MEITKKSSRTPVASTTITNIILVIRCEDAMYLLRKDVKSQQLTNTSVLEIAEAVVAEVAPSLEFVAGEGLAGIKFEAFNIVDATAWDALKKFKVGLIRMCAENSSTFCSATCRIRLQLAAKWPITSLAT